ncbi:unnamed protein product [Gongylonema pulchrum]|uniref:Uncharacterized protein n=1 Tax=Gongylonema pulchrum TaxID=637853 RepID=A0A183DRG5_9BILA|nr:unnamed protein product [Gongylonema pulchrum]
MVYPNFELASPIDLKNQVQENAANGTDSHRLLPEGYWATSATRDAFLERCDVGEGSSLRSICRGSLLNEQVLASQSSSLSVLTNEDLFVAELARTKPALFESVCDIIFKQCDFRPPINLHAEAAIGQNRQLSLQPMPSEKMEFSLAGYCYQQTNVSSYRFYFQGL